MGRSRFLGGCLLAGLALVAGGLALFVWRGSPFPSMVAAGPVAVSLGVVVAMCVRLCWCWWRTPAGWLTWAPVVTDAAEDLASGREPASGWWWTPVHGTAALPLGEPVVVLDAGSRLALRMPATPVGASTGRLFGAWVNRATLWLWVDQTMFPSRWLALRRAVWAARVD